jgi:hypothetical protein
MNGNIKVLNGILERFKFREPLPLEVKENISKYEYKSVIRTLKAVKEYNIFYGSIIRIFYLSYKMKLRISITQCKIIFGIISAISALFLSAGIIFCADLIKNSKYNVPEIIQLNRNISAGLKNTSIDAEKVIQNNEIENVIKANPPEVKSVSRIGISAFLSKNVDEKLSAGITDSLKEKLSDAIGSGKIIDLREKRKELHYNKILTGSVSRLGSKYIITVKVMNIEDSRIIFGSNNMVNSESELNDRCVEIAEKIIKEINKKI